MQTIGERLEEARKRKGISIREAAEHTKIRGDYLQKFEANSFDIDLPPLYIRGFVRTYSRYLELDPERIVSEVDAALSRDGKPSRREHREALGRVDFGATETRSQETGESTAGSQAARDKAMLLKFGLIVGGAIVGIIVIILLINVLFAGTPAKPAATAPNQTADTQAVPAIQSREAIFTITVLEPTRVKVAYPDNSTVFLDGKYPLNRGETKSIHYNTQDLLVTVEHPERIRIELNGRAVDVPTRQPMSQFRVPFEARQ